MSSSKKLLQSASGYINQTSSGGDVNEVFAINNIRQSSYGNDGGNGTRQVVNNIDLQNEGGLVWVKSRTSSQDHSWTDSNRGSNWILCSNSTAAQSNSNWDVVSSFNTDGFTYKNGYSLVNNYISYTFRKARKFFDIQTYTGNGTAGRQISHNLGVAPGFIIVKNISNAGEPWYTYHKDLGNSKYIKFNDATSSVTSIEPWNNTTPTDAHVTVYSSNAVNGSGQSYVMYLFAHDPDDDGIIKCGQYYGNGSTGWYTGSGNGHQISPAGFEPQWLLVRGENNYNWVVVDTARHFDVSEYTENLYPQSSSYTPLIQTYPPQIYPSAEGFGISSTGTNFNSNNVKYVYVAIRGGPGPTPTSRNQVFGYDSAGYTGSNTKYPAFSMSSIMRKPDYVWERNRASGNFWRHTSRLLGGAYLRTGSNSTNDMHSSSVHKWDYDGNDWAGGFGGVFENAQFNSHSAWMWARAKGFLDVVQYKGNGVNGRSERHSLGVVPDMIWHKMRDGSIPSYNRGWVMGSRHLPNTTTTQDSVIYPDSNSGESVAAMFNNTPPTNSHFSLSNDPMVNLNNALYMTYLFASCPGVSKIGTFTHTSGSVTTVDCGFSSGIYFLLMKRTDSSIAGDWYVWDQEWGINAGNEAYMTLNGPGSHSSFIDWIDPLNNGFQATAAFNPSGTYFYYAIAN